MLLLSGPMEPAEHCSMGEMYPELHLVETTFNDYSQPGRHSVGHRLSA